MTDDGRTPPVGGEELWECGECRATSDYKPQYTSDLPQDWYRLEDRACVFVCCSLKCLQSLVVKVAETSLEDAVDNADD
jgi:hypothetical protein